MENPFIEFNKITGTKLTIPKFPRKVEIEIAISREAFIGLEPLRQKYTNTKQVRAGISKLLECIGLYTLHLTDTVNLIDPVSNVTTDECRQSGFEDGIMGESHRFLLMFGKTLSSEFQEAYMRGFFEGSFIRNKDK